MRIAAWLISSFNNLDRGQQLGIKLGAMVFLITEIFLGLVSRTACIVVFLLMLLFATLALIVALCYGEYDEWINRQ